MKQTRVQGVTRPSPYGRETLDLSAQEQSRMEDEWMIRCNYKSILNAWKHSDDFLAPANDPAVKTNRSLLKTQEDSFPFTFLLLCVFWKALHPSLTPQMNKSTAINRLQKKKQDERRRPGGVALSKRFFMFDTLLPSGQPACARRLCAALLSSYSTSLAWFLASTPR